jgi:hypothetical protein
MTHRDRLLTVLFSVAAGVAAAPHVAFAQAQCTLPGVPFTSMSAVIAQGGHLASDGRGTYVDGTQGSTVNLHNGASLVTNDGAAVNKNSRYITFNLGNPVPGDPLAQPLGAIQDRRGEVRVLYKLDPPPQPGEFPIVHAISEVPDDGVPVVSERTDLFVHIGGVRHLIMFGGDTWPLNICRPDLGLVFDAPGTTKLSITRVGDTYTLQAPAGSIGRLFDYTNQFAQVDKGLYRFNFLVTMTPKPKKGK